MASIISRPNNNYWIQFAFKKKRPVIRLGRCSRKAANEFKVGIERLVSEISIGHPSSQQTLAWLDSLPIKLQKKLAAAGVVKDQPGRNLAPFLEYVFERLEVKQSTLTGYKQTKRNLIEHFGAEHEIGEITEGDAENFRSWLKTQNRMRKDGVMAATTVSKRCQRAREFFDVAVKHRWIPKNPFAVLNGWTTSNPDRMEFIPEATIKKAMAFCDPEWHLILALCRYGGLRCPSEVNALEWQHVDWDADVMHVQSPKTERFAGKASREVPIFAELRPYLQAAWDAAPVGATFVVQRRCSGQALRHQLERILKRANVPMWGKLFQNLRSTRETELLERFPLQVVCTWIGNTPEIALRHYLQITKEHIAKAVGGAAESAATASPNAQKRCKK